MWYVASLKHVPRWVSVELNTLIFKFFWSSKRDLVARHDVVQTSCLGGFSVVDFQCKVMAPHVQWVRPFVSSPSSWVSFMVFWCQLFFFDLDRPVIDFCWKVSHGSFT